MEMEVRRFLSAVDAVVLERQDSKRLKSPYQRPGNALCRYRNSLALVLREIEQRSDMSARDHAALTKLELPRIDHRKRELALIDDRPAFFAPCDPLAQVAGISFR